MIDVFLNVSAVIQSSALKYCAITMLLTTLQSAAQDCANFRFVIQSDFARTHRKHYVRYKYT